MVLLLFNLFVNDIAAVIDLAFLMFADDIKIFTGVRSGRSNNTFSLT